MNLFYGQNGITITSITTGQTTTIASGSTPAQILAAWQSLAPLAEQQASKQTDLDTFLDQLMSLNAFIRAGSVTTITGAQIGTFLATICNNYRTLRAAIAAATTPAQVAAVNVNSGWPTNP